MSCQIWPWWSVNAEFSVERRKAVKPSRLRTWDSIGGESGDAGVVVGGWVADGAGSIEGGTDALAVGRGNFGLSSEWWQTS